MAENRIKKIYSLSIEDLRQRVIYYQSEAAKYKFLSDKYELLLTKALQLKTESNEENREEQTKEEQIECTAYFNYSLIQEKEEKPYIYGSFNIKNTGNCSLNTPIICLKSNEPNLITIGGKIGEINLGDDKIISSFETWTYIHGDWREKWAEKGELWLKPKETSSIEAGGKLSFSSFDITFKDEASFKSINIEGYCYFEELTTGVKSLNSISLTL